MRLKDVDEWYKQYNRLIEELTAHCQFEQGYRYGLGIAKDWIARLPTIEAEPVRHGRCDFCKDGKSFIGASLLLGNDGKWHEIKCCPNCGCKMDGDSHEA